MKNLLIKKLFVLCLAFFASTNVMAAESKFTSEDAKKFVDEVGNKIVSIANEKAISEAKKREKIIAVVDGVIDSDWISRFVLGKNYKTITDQQKETFTKLYRSFMINTYGPKFKNYNGRKFTVNEVQEQGSFYIAKAEFLPRDSNVPVSVDFRVKDKGGKLVVLDFVAEGISLIETQRSEFNSAISKDGIDKFLIDLSVRVKALEKKQ